MTMCDEGGPPVFFARAPAGSWPDEGGDCRWCSILLGPTPVSRSAVPGSAPGEHGRARSAEWRTDGLRTWPERVRPVMLPLAALTVLAVLALAVWG
ncbi:hypothetical protein ACFW9L_17510 [Streptomyces sp. NPDC059517]|uniref:hypothetical protein n=1 Tax=Streptomyces sp. NPDC059517 TaxID=3346855 RepID=UPI003686C622